MSQSLTICHRLVDDIINKGKQQLSDRRLIATCLSHHLLNTKQHINNELLMQAGIHSESARKQNDLAKDCMGKGLGREKWGTKDVKVEKKRKIAGVGVKRKGMSLPGSSRKKLGCEGMSYSKVMASTGKSFTKSHFSPHAQKFTKLVFSAGQNCPAEPPASKQYGSEVEKMRESWLNCQSAELQQTLRQQQEQISRVEKIKKEQSKFERELQAGANEHTYHTNGKYIVISAKSMAKAISTSYPIVMSSIVPGTPKKAHNRHRKSMTTPYNPQHTDGLHSQTKQSTHRTKLQQFFTAKQKTFNNNDNRQVSNLQLIQPTDRVHYNQKLMHSVMQTIETEAPSKPKSTFRKYLSQSHNETRPKTQDGQPNSQSSQEEDSQLEDRRAKARQLPRRPRTSVYHGSIRDVNQPLLRTLISNK